ncbi:non-canonical purine NTP pyrophosphatase [Patescibacteria group bacterium]
MKIKKLVIGSSNPGKINEWKFFLKDKVNLISANDAGIIESPEETEDTFLKNAIQKARYYADKTHEYVLSEDGGFEVDYLDGLPGIKSRRILLGDKDGTDKQLIAYILNKLKGVPKEKRTARLTVTVVVADPKGKIIFQDKNSIEGIISVKFSKKIEDGYPYRSILFLPKISKFYSELTEEEHKKVAHRKDIAERLYKFLLEYK